MVGAAASALAELRPGASGTTTASNANSSQSVGSAYSSSFHHHRPTPFSQRADPSSPEKSTTDSQASDDEDDGETQHGDGSASAGMAHVAYVAHGSGDGAGSGASLAPTVSADANAASASTSTSKKASGSAASSLPDTKKPRACEACRGLKVRCDMDPNAPADTPCRRCAKAGRNCIVTQPTRRRPKKTDSRVAELEKKIDALTASLQLTRQSGSGSGAAEIPVLSQAAVPGPVPAAAKSITKSTSTAPPTDKDLPSKSGIAVAGGSAPVPSSHSPYTASAGGRSTYPPVPPPMVMAGQKRKFSEIREATGVVGAGAGGGGSGSRASLGSRAGSVTGDESPSVRENPYGHHAQLHAQNHAQHASQARHHGHDDKPPQTQQQAPAFSMSPSPAAAGSSTRFGTEYADIIDRGLLTMDKAVELFQRYTDHMVRHMPAVVFSPGTTAAEIRKAKPVLFLSLMAAATTEMPDVQRAIVKEMMQVFAEKVFVTGEKSLEIVQALQVAVIWYWPPDHFEELKFYQLVHTSAIMAIDIGLGKRRPGTKCGPSGAVSGFGGSLLRGGATSGSGLFGFRCNDRRGGCGGGGDGGGDADAGDNRSSQWNGGKPYSDWRDHPFKKYPLPDPCSIEGRRAWLACYFLTSNTAMALHRPTLFRWTSFMTECVDVLESSPDAAPTDQYFCHLVWTHRMAEEVGQQFSMDDPSTVINIADPRTQYALRGFERELERYKANIPQNLLQPCLRLSFEVVSLYMHEIALQTENGNDDFKAPYTAESTKEALIGDATLTPAHIRALTSCLLSIDGIFDAFLGMDIAALRCIPVFNFVRVAYATVVMIKLYLFASSPNSELGKVIDKEHMKVEQHLSALLDKFRATAAGNKSRPAGKFMIVLAMVRSWFLKQQAFENRGGGGEPEGAGVGAGAGVDAGGQYGAGHDRGRSQPQRPASTSFLSGPPPAAASCTQPNFPSSGLLSTMHNLNNRGSAATTNAQASANSSAAATPTSNASYTTSGTAQQHPFQQTQQTQQMQPAAAMYSTANTPLQLLSEIAANDYAATAATAAANTASSMGAQPSTQLPPPPPQQQPIPPWPPFYASMPNNGNPNPASGPDQRRQPQPQHQPQPAPVGPLMQPPAQAMTTNDYMSLYPHLSLGENFEYAVDLTFGGLAEGANDLNLSDGLQYLLTDPWFGGVPGEAFQL